MLKDIAHKPAIKPRKVSRNQVLHPVVFDKHMFFFSHKYLEMYSAKMLTEKYPLFVLRGADAFTDKASLPLSSEVCAQQQIQDFPEEGGANYNSRGADLLFWSIFPPGVYPLTAQKLHEIKKFGSFRDTPWMSGGSRISQTGRRQLPRRGANLLFGEIFPKNCVKMK